MQENQKRIFIGTPMYGGQCYGAYTDSLVKLVRGLEALGIEIHFCALFNESHIDRARNVITNEFLKSNFNYLLFIDSDISGFNATHVSAMLDRDKEITCGFYPKKRINWAVIIEAVKAGLADKDPEVLAKFVGDMVFTPALNDDSNRTRSIYELTLLHEGGTGFMLVKREVFARIRFDNPELTYFGDGPDKPEITAFFDAKIDPIEVPYKRFLTEDYDFCRLARQSGFDIWLAPWIKLTHHGYYAFQGDIEALARAKTREKAA